MAMHLKSVRFKIGLPHAATIEGVWEPTDQERRAAWELYVELITRVAVVELKPGEGLIREALSSLHSLFGTTRAILRQYGPEVARTQTRDGVSLGYLAVAILNLAIRPFLSKWHPLLSDWEARRGPGVSPLEHEQSWDRYDELWQELDALQKSLKEYSRALADAAGVPSLWDATLKASKQGGR